MSETVKDGVSDRDERETLQVIVDEPQLSTATNRQLTSELREVIGSDTVEVPAGRDHPSRGERPEHPHAGVRIPKRVGAGLAVAAVVIIAVVAATSAHWWVVPVAFAVLGVVTYIVLASTLQLTSNLERPAATTVAALESEGVPNAEEHFSELVAEFTEDAGEQGENQRTTNVEDDPAKAAAEQKHAITPSGGATRPVGPGSSA